MYVLPLGLRSTKSLFVLLSDVYTFYLVEPKWSKVSAIAHTAYGHSRPSYAASSIDPHSPLGLAARLGEQSSVGAQEQGGFRRFIAVAEKLPE